MVFYLGCIPTVVTKKRDSITSHLRLFYTLTRKFRCVDENEAQLATIWDINNTFCSGTISCISTACLTNRIYTYFFYFYVSQDRRTILNWKYHPVLLPCISSSLDSFSNGAPIENVWQKKCRFVKVMIHLLSDIDIIIVSFTSLVSNRWRLWHGQTYACKNLVKTT